MASLIETRLREAMAEFLDIYNKARATSVFGNLVMDTNAPEGFFKPSVVTLPGEATEFKGNATVHDLDSATRIYETLVYEYTLGIDRNKLEKLDAISKGEVTRIIRGMVKKAIGHMDKRLTALLLTGESTGSIAGGAFFSATAALPGGQTFDNIVGTGVSGSAAEVRSAIRAAQAHFISMRNAGNDLSNDAEPTIGLMYDPRKTNGVPIHQSVADAINPDRLDGGAKFTEGSVIPMANGYFDGTVDDLWFFDVNADTKSFIAGWQQRPILESNVGVATDGQRILNRQDLFQTSWSYEVAFGDNQKAVLGNDA